MRRTDGHDTVGGPPLPEADEILAATWAALGSLGRLLPPRLDLRERQRCGGLVRCAAPQRVRAVLRALSTDAGLFAEEPLDAPALGRRQRRAAAYLHLFATLEDLRGRARDAYLREQAGAAEEADRVHLRLSHEAADPDGPTPDLHRKALLLRDGCPTPYARRRRRG